MLTCGTERGHSLECACVVSLKIGKVCKTSFHTCNHIVLTYYNSPSVDPGCEAAVAPQLYYKHRDSHWFRPVTYGQTDTNVRIIEINPLMDYRFIRLGAELLFTKDDRGQRSEREQDTSWSRGCRILGVPIYMCNRWGRANLFAVGQTPKYAFPPSGEHSAAHNPKTSANSQIGRQTKWGLPDQSRPTTQSEPSASYLVAAPSERQQGQ